MTTTTDFTRKLSGKYTVAELNTLFTNVATVLNDKMPDSQQSDSAVLTATQDVQGKRIINGADQTDDSAAITVSQAKRIVGVSTDTALAGWRAKRDGNVKITVIGDSIEEGFNASLFYSRWVQKVEADLRIARGLPNAYQSYFRAAYFSGLGEVLARIGTTTEVDSYGLARRSLLSAANTASGASLTIAMTGCDIFYTKGGGVGRFTYQVDSGPITTVDTESADTVGSQKVEIRGLDGSPHTIKVVSELDAEVFILEGIQVYYHDEPEVTKGIHVINGGHAGFRTDQFVYDPNIDQLDTTRDALKGHGGDLVVVALGLNDFIQGNTAASARLNLNRIFQNIRNTLPDADVFMPIPHELLEGGVSKPDPWATWRDMYETVAKENGCATVDWADSLGSFNDGSIYDSGDGIHPNDAGHAILASQFLTRIGQ